MGWDVIVVGAGISGASIAYFLSDHYKVLLLEREEQPGYHSTGRSAAVYTENYGPDPIAALVKSSRDFLTKPPPGFSEKKLLAPLGALTVGGKHQEDVFQSAWQKARERVPDLELHDISFALQKVPILRPDVLDRCFWEPGAFDIDVHNLHWSYLHGLAANGGRLVTGAELLSATRNGSLWQVKTGNGESYEASILVNAAGAWADEIAKLSDVAPLGLQPRRRTAIMIDLPPQIDVAAYPMTTDVGGGLYFRGVSGRLLISPSDATAVTPSDAQPEELDIANAVDRFSRLTTCYVRRISAKWAGLRTFAPDDVPVVGWDADVRGFFWVAGQGGAGIKTSPAIGMLAAAQIKGKVLPSQLAAQGIDPAALQPGRFSAPAH